MGERPDENAIVAAVRASEARTRGQIVCVLARQSCDTASFVTLYAAGVALIAPWPLLEWTHLAAQYIFSVQICVFVLALAVFSATRLGVLLTPRRVRRRHAYQMALEQFFSRGLAATRARAGVLIFVSMKEHYARIVADPQLNCKISERDWRTIVDEMTTHLREGRITESFTIAVTRCGDLLSMAAPPDGGGDNELPDELVRLD
jgi:putative membrane protein